MSHSPATFTVRSRQPARVKRNCSENAQEVGKTILLNVQGPDTENVPYSQQLCCVMQCAWFCEILQGWEKFAGKCLLAWH